VRDYLDQLDAEEKEFCKDTIFEYASMPLKNDYGYQAGDGVGAAINILPLLLRLFPQESKRIKETLLFTLFDSYPIGMSQRLSDYTVSAIVYNLWKESSADANSIFLGYLLLKPKFDGLRDSIRKANRQKGIYDFSNSTVLERFMTEHESEIAKVISNQIAYDEIPRFPPEVFTYISNPNPADSKKFRAGLEQLLQEPRVVGGREDHRRLRALGEFQYFTDHIIDAIHLLANDFLGLISQGE